MERFDLNGGIEGLATLLQDASGLALDWQSERGLCLLRKRLRRIRASQGEL